MGAAEKGGEASVEPWLTQCGPQLELLVGWAIGMVSSLCISTMKFPGKRPNEGRHAEWFEQGRGPWLKAQTLKKAGAPPGARWWVVLTGVTE